MVSLRGKAGKAVGWDLTGSYLVQLIGLVISVVLARLLRPEDFGLVGMSLAFINALDVFTDFGLSSSLVQNESNTSLTYSSVFYLNLLLGVVLAAAVFFSAELVGHFYANEKVAVLVRLFSVVFVINSFDAVQRSILKRNLDFKTLALRNVMAQAVAGAVAVGFALYGFGVYTLVIQTILAALINTVILWRVADWYPRWEFSWAEIRKLSSFSAYLFAARSGAQLMRQADTFVLGKLFSPAIVGYFSRANLLNALVTKNSSESINKVLFPLLCTVQNEEDRFREVYLKTVGLVAGSSIFLSGVFFLCGEKLILLLYGRQWEPSVPIFRLLIPVAFTFPLSSLMVNVFLARGKSRENFHYGNVRKVLQAVPLVVAYRFGFWQYLQAFMAISVLCWLLNAYFVTRSLGIGFFSQVKEVLGYLAVSTVILVAVSQLLPNGTSVGEVTVRIGIFVVVFFGYCYLFNTTLFKELLLYRSTLWRKLTSTSMPG